MAKEIKKINLTIDGKPVSAPAGTTILDAASGVGIAIPTLCHLEGLAPFTSCFLCVVDVEKHANPAPACSTAVSEGMVVHTRSPRILATRKMCLELLFSDHCGDCVAPCTLTCPAGCNIQEFMKDIEENRLDDAIHTIKETLPIPGALGRICPRPCEARCRRVRVEEPLAIGWSHRYAADKDAATGTVYRPATAPGNGKRVAVVGAGPGGMAAAYFLRRMGYGVAVLEAEAEPGGMMRWGIPAYRLPREELWNEFKAIIGMGVDMRYRKALGRDFSLADLRKEGFQAIFLAVGAPISSALQIPGETLPGVMGGVEFLGNVAHNKPVAVGRRVAVIGGGNTAIDAVRTARRLKAEEVTLVYRRTRAEMPALPVEIQEAEREGVKFRLLAAPVEIKPKAGRLALVCQQMELGEPGPDGRRKPVPVKDAFFELEVDTVIAAIGQKIDAAILKKEGIELDKKGNAIVVNPYTLQTAIPDVFAGGDAVAREDQKIAVWAVGSGRIASICIDQYLNGRPVIGRPKEFRVTLGEKPDQVTASRFVGVRKSVRAKMPEVEPEDRVTSFREVELGLTPDMAQAEAGRCLSCGCGAAGACKMRDYAIEYGAEPDRFAGATREYEVDTSHPRIIIETGKCIDCGLCVRVCHGDKKLEIFGFLNRGFDTRVKPYFDLPLAETVCDACMKCVEICPTGALVDRVNLWKTKRHAACKGAVCSAGGCATHPAQG